MAQEQNISQDLYDLLVSKNLDPETSNEAGLDAQSNESSVFSFDWKSTAGRNYGTAVVVITDDGELILFFGDNLGRGMEEPDKTEWYDFMRTLKDFATRNNLKTFDSQNLSKLKHTMAGMAAIREGLFEGYYGNRRVSYMGEEREARLMIKHRKTLSETDRRHLNVESLFIETVEGERFKLPFTDLRGGKAMLTHVREGGRPYDVRGVHIAEMVEELKVLSRFNRASAGRVVEGVTQTLVEQAREYYRSLRESIRRMGGHRGYQHYFETWTPLTETESESLVEDIKTLFIEQTLDTRIEAALPVLARIKRTTMREADIFESYIDRLVEGTWAVPDTPESERKLQELMAEELPVGPDATNATEQLYDLIGDDELYDQLEQLARDDPDADARPLIQARLEEMGYNIGMMDDEQAQIPDQDLQETTKRHHFIYEQEPKLDPWGGSRAEYEQEREAERAAFQAKLDQHQKDIRASQVRHTASLYDRPKQKPKQEPKRDTASGKKQQSAGSAGKDDFVAPHGDVKQELELFAAGRKPAAIVNEPHFGLWKRLIDSGRYVLRPLTGEGGRQSGLVIGQPDQEDRVSKIQALVQNATDAGLKGDFRAYQNSNYHRWLGRLLGYPAEAIERFVTNYFRDTEDLAKQRVDEQDLLEFTGDEMQYATTPASTAANDPERPVGVLMFGRFGKTDPYARTAWAALQRELPREYPNEDAAAAKVAEIAQQGGAVVTEKPRSEAERLVKRFQAYGVKSRIVDDNLREQNTALGRRMPRIGDTLQWRTMQDTTTRTGTVLDIKGFDVTVKPKRLPGETTYPRPMGVNLANKQLTYRVIPAELSMTQPGGWTPQTALEADNLATFEGSGCNHTMEGESCPVHGLQECGMHESDDREDYDRTAAELNQARQSGDLERVKELTGKLLKRAGPQGFEIDIQGDAKPVKETELDRIKKLASY